MQKSFAKSIVFVLLLFLSPKLFADSSALLAVKAAESLLARLIPVKYQQHFQFEKITSAIDVFELEDINGRLIIRGNNANSMAVGLNHYLKYYCNTSVSWYKADSLYLPAQLPSVPQKVRQQARCKNRFFLNYCTFGYTMPWWQWDDWQWFIDWMALNGINMPLAITGQEAVWYRVWKKYGLTDAQIRGYFTGPAFLPWHRMANLDHWDGPLPQSWLSSQLKLQQKIVARERELGMKPILPAFAGHVPELLKTKFPKAKITSLGEWAEFDKKYQSYFLDPFDPLYNAIQKEFLKEQTTLFGTDHIYGTDPFNEVTPPSWESSYLASVSKNTYSSLKAADPAAQWLQMTWIFYFQRENWTNPRIKAYLKAVPQDKMILLDYYCDSTEVWKQTDKFFGQPYIWCYLGNFGGNTMLAGNLKQVEERMENAFINGGKNMWGVGSTLEGFDMNPVIYEYVLEKAWSAGPTDTDKWIANWAARRHGAASDSIVRAWNVLNNEVYIKNAALGQSPLTNARPSLTGHGEWPTNPEIPYDNKSLLKAWRLMLNSDTLTATARFDLINIGRQALGNYFNVLRDRFTAAYNSKNLDSMKLNGDAMLHVIDDMDTLLATHSSFLLGRWINQARAMGINPEERNYYEANARRILTTWGARGGVLTDYASRNWAGLMKSYYHRRWEMFINDVTEAVKSGKAYEDKAFEQKSFDFEWEWTTRHDKFVNKPVGDALQISKYLYQKYATAIGAN
ncbi:alpha-N-acetylglucosaminidase [Mucilaginibacter limnophilus]|uniref:Alpha-N-acetylglucosaminidase n=1 Tax=Mucilaginibacter limnophilus TaxID=1932778 RepID=A0A3S2UNU6_9SPHI|nr:alpha-N-acetylglucosaminidase [Mucilaginibacter limnophilus]RVU03049.1 alpha-N-acetylglucosaminidase [Mucilaginibacter limnophilus]